MNLFGRLSGTIPTYNQGQDADSAQLQVESLNYVFKRLRINKLAPLPSKEGFKWIDEYKLESAKDDAKYNLERMKEILLRDERRILVDYFKNKFRALCMLSVQTSNELRDYRDHKVPKFRFLWVPLVISADELCSLLASSDIYVEHTSVTPTLRELHAKESVSKHVKVISNTYSPLTLSEAQRAAIIRTFLNKVAFNVQLDRIYKEYLKQKSTSVTPAGSPTKKAQGAKLAPAVLKADFRLQASAAGLRRPTSPERRPASPEQRAISPERRSTTSSDIRQGLGSPGRLKSKPSISRMRLDELYNPVASPPLSHVSTFQEADPVTEVDEALYEKCRVAILERLRRERELISKEA